MRVTDLRISNLVNNHDRLYSIDCVGDLSRIDIMKDHFTGIPLTEEWLVRLGFDKSYQDYTKGILQIENEYTDAGEWNVTIGRYKSSLDIKYVHQIQNLYFALTGEELELKYT